MATPPWTSDGWQSEPPTRPERRRWLRLGIAAGVAIALVVLGLTVMVMVRDSGPTKADRYRAAEVRDGLVVLGSEGYGSDSDIDRTAAIVCEVLGEQARETGSPLNGQIAETLVALKSAEAVDLIGTTLGVDPGFAGVDFKADRTGFARFATSAGRSIANLRSVYCPTAPFDPSAPPTSPGGGGDARPPTPSAAAPSTTDSTQSSNQVSTSSAGEACSDPRAIATDPQTWGTIVCDFSGSTNGGQWRSAPGISNETHRVGEPCDSSTDTIGRDESNKAILCAGTTWAAGP